MKDRMTHNLIRILSTQRGVACLDDENWILRFGRMHIRRVLKKTKKVIDINVSS
jgi:hypothetical protein